MRSYSVFPSLSSSFSPIDRRSANENDVCPDHSGDHWQRKSIHRADRPLFPPELVSSKWSEKRVRRMVNGESTARSQLDADSLTAVLRGAAVASLRESTELTLVLDGMALRRAGANAQEGLMRVKGLDARWVNGYRSVNVLGLGTGSVSSRCVYWLRPDPRQPLASPLAGPFGRLRAAGQPTTGQTGPDPRRAAPARSVGNPCHFRPTPEGIRRFTPFHQASVRRLWLFFSPLKLMSDSQESAHDRDVAGRTNRVH